MKHASAADHRQLTAAFAKEIGGLVAKWNHDQAGNAWADDARSVAECTLMKLALAGEIVADDTGAYPAALRKRAYVAMRHAVHAELTPLAKPLSASVNTLGAYRKAKRDFEKSRPDDDFANASVNTVVATLGCSPCFAFRAKASQKPRSNTDKPDSPAAHLADESAAHPADKLQRDERTRAIHAALDRMPVNKQALLVRLHGLDGHAPRSLTEIARDLGISRQSLDEQVGRVYAHLRPALADYALAA